MGETSHNNVRALREAQLMSKAELARKAGLSPLTIDRVESGKPCRMDTKRKLILALGLKLADRHKVFPEEAPSAGPGPRPKRQRTREGGSEPASADAASSSEGPRGEASPGATADGDTGQGEDSPSGERREGGTGRGAKSA